jgi:hypothetical protein
MSLNFCEKLFTYGIYRAQGLNLFARNIADFRFNNRVNETLRITVELKIVSEATNFLMQILGIWTMSGQSTGTE